MTLAALIVFFASLVGITFLFSLKKIEMNRPVRFADRMRTRADDGARVVKHWLEVSEWYLENAPFFLGALTRYGVHIGALSFARLARSSERYAHELADLVSHKHRFERRETKSRFLKEVGEYKNGNGSDTTTVETQ